jgi:hypothetical protein
MHRPDVEAGGTSSFSKKIMDNYLVQWDMIYEENMQQMSSKNA